MAVRGPIESLAIPALSGEAVWRHPLLDGLDPALREDLLKLAARIPEPVEATERLPQAMVHGDACPQNLLDPAGDPDGFAPIDVDDVRCGFQAVLVLRSAFMSLPLDRLGESDPPTDDLARHLAERVRLTRYLVDLGLSL